MSDFEGHDQRSGPGRRADDTVVPLREYLESKIAQLEATMGVEMAHMKQDILDAQSEFRDGISHLRNDLSGLSVGLHKAMVELQQSIARLDIARRDTVVTWRVVAKVVAFVAAFITTMAALTALVVTIVNAVHA